MRYYFLLLALLVSGCGQHTAALPTIKPYKMDIQQGNAVTPKMMMQLRPGMSKSQVRFIMGTPLLVDSFHADRWDYFYQMRKEGKIIEQRRVILEFEGDELKRVRGDVIPAGGDPGAVTVEPLKVPAKSKEDEKGLLDRLKFWEGDEKPKAQPAPEQKAAPVADQPAAKEVVQPVTEEVAPSARLPEIAPQPIPETLPPLTEPLTEEAPAVAAPVEKKVAPAPVAKPVEAKPAEVKPVSKPVPAPAEPVKPAPAKVVPVEEPRSETKPKPAPKPVEAKAPPKPGKDLPPEDAPDFFEKMLEKIGF
jgi:outer membrane protein assembly factor BamE